MAIDMDDGIPTGLVLMLLCVGFVIVGWALDERDDERRRREELEQKLRELQEQRGPRR